MKKTPAVFAAATAISFLVFAVIAVQAAEKPTRNKRVLFVASEFGYWGEELVAPYEILEAAGYKVDFATPKGGKPLALPPSMDTNYVDPPLGKKVTTPEMAAKVAALENSTRLNKPINLSAWLPGKPYLSSSTYLDDLHAYYDALDKADEEIRKYDALVIVGGSGPILDVANNKRVQDLIRLFLKQDKPVAGICYGVAAIAFTRDEITDRSVVFGKRVTGHPVVHDYNDGHGYIKIDHIFPGAPYQLEYILKDAVGPDGQFIANIGKRTSVIVDYPIITARTTFDSTLCGEKLVEVLNQGLTRYGW
ncbi:type 1 glutamine amidotransferase domain-containing protein [Solidesulfovibrio carbinolicus]|uniref:Type 1 glutamine amidotransferase domain-containing protein n=1 Tax=Solidesulfovibrio carbinolicus TaxID=296842 RepID=A0A4P6HM33_9BACT|nr:type 1 glutamine amidotransferase domain-containing protein [Solidesulfovibrio carbinolicus]QAZ68273.1 type 1 glutamine amidotransferase domain-containing protein [Solidesulfovibrio carbinolicus]